MLQRIQSFFLFLVALSMLSMLFFPLWNKVDVDKSEIVTVTALVLMHEQVDPITDERTLVAETQMFYLAILAVIAAAVALYSISRYDDRLLQMKLGALNSLVMGAVLGAAIYNVYQVEKEMEVVRQGTYLFGFYAGIAALLFNMLSNRFIRRDDKLVKSADRMR